MARLRDSRSPNPAGSQKSSNRNRRGDDRRHRDRDRNWGRRDSGRGLSRSRSPRDRRYRDRDRLYDNRHRDRSPARRDDHYPGGRDRRYADRDREPLSDRRRRRSRDLDTDRDYRNRREESRDRNRGRREGTADSHARSRRVGSRERGQTPDDGVRAIRPTNQASKPAHTSAAAAAAASQADADKKAERLAKLAAWKKKQEDKEKEKQKEATPGATRKLLAEMDEKVTGTYVSVSPIAAASVAIADAAPPLEPTIMPDTPYAGKFDPKAIAKKSAPKGQPPSTVPMLGDISGGPNSSALAPKTATASALPQTRSKTSGFGFQKQGAESDKAVPQKRKLMLDEDDTSVRKLAKLPSLPLPDVDDTPYEHQDEEDDEDAGNFVGDEEEEAAAARAAQERREEKKAQETQQDSGEMDVDVPTLDPVPQTDPVAAETHSTDAMAVDEPEEEDPLDAFMVDLQTKPVAGKPAASKINDGTKPDHEPEAYFSDDEYDYRNKESRPHSVLALAVKARKKKDIPAVDYTKLKLEPIRKNFWVEPAELSDLTEAELTDLRLELDGINVSGNNVPKPVQKWSQLALSRKTLDIIDTLGFNKPTPIQMQAFPAIMSGRDIIGIAKTGSGKTLAFLLPMFRHIKDQGPLKDNDGPVGLIMTPTRELATQIHRDCKPFLKSMGLRAVCAYGGAPIKDHIAELKRGAEIVVCTPGRMIDLLAANQGRVTNLKRATYVVLDEADRMFDMGFEPQVMKILTNMRPDRQTILFSATMPRLMDSLTKKVLNDPVKVTVGGRSVVAAEITQIVEIRDEEAKFVRLLELLGELYDTDEDARTLVFVERQEKADDLFKELMQKGYPCMSIHGGKDQVDRDSAIQDFKAGVVPILVATSVAARGLDVKQLKLVVNYDAPSHLEDYVHRVGRTGRAGNKGTAVTFVMEDQESCAPGIVKALQQSGQPVPEKLEEMLKAFKEKVKSGEIKNHTGFEGKGLKRLDQQREAARLRERKTHKTEGDDDEPEDDKKGVTDDKTDKARSAIQAAASGVQARNDAPPVKLETKFTIHKRELPAAGSSNDPLDKVSSAIDAINARLGKAGQLRNGQPIDNKGPDAGAYHARLEINDFPQKARWAVTNRTNVAKILEATGTSITTKGTFYPLGKDVQPGGEPKLYILVEGDTELVVENAMSELTRLLEEGTLAAANAESRAPVGGRYSVT